MKHTRRLFGLNLLFMGLLLSSCVFPSQSPTNQTPIDVLFLLYVPEAVTVPGGPMIQMTLRNESSDSVVSLSAELPRSPGVPLPFHFDVSQSNSLLPGASVSSSSRLVGPSQAGKSVTISGSLQNGASFSYTRQIQILDIPLSDQRPAQVVSVLGPLSQNDPAGPSIRITLMNVSSQPITALSATIAVTNLVDGVTKGSTRGLDFKVTSTSPLLPGSSISSSIGPIEAGFSGNVSFPLTISGVLQDGTKFAYVEQVVISALP